MCTPSLVLICFESGEYYQFVLDLQQYDTYHDDLRLNELRLGAIHVLKPLFSMLVFYVKNINYIKKRKKTKINQYKNSYQRSNREEDK